MLLFRINLTPFFIFYGGVLVLWIGGGMLFRFLLV